MDAFNRGLSRLANSPVKGLGLRAFEGLGSPRVVPCGYILDPEVKA